MGEKKTSNAIGCRQSDFLTSRQTENMRIRVSIFIYLIANTARLALLLNSPQEAWH